MNLCIYVAYDTHTHTHTHTVSIFFSRPEANNKIVHCWWLFFLFFLKEAKQQGKNLSTVIYKYITPKKIFRHEEVLVIG